MRFIPNIPPKVMRHKALILKSAEQNVYETYVIEKAIVPSLVFSAGNVGELHPNDTCSADFSFLMLQN